MYNKYYRLMEIHHQHLHWEDADYDECGHPMRISKS
jgi:hypothetical protein